MKNLSLHFTALIVLLAGIHLQAEDMVLTHKILEDAYPGYVCNNSYYLLDADFECFSVIQVSGGKYQVVHQTHPARSNKVYNSDTYRLTSDGRAYNLPPYNSEQEALRQLNVKASTEYDNWRNTEPNKSNVKMVEDYLRSIPQQPQTRPRLNDAPTLVNDK